VCTPALGLATQTTVADPTAASSGQPVRRDFGAIIGSYRVIAFDRDALNRELARNGFSSAASAQPLYGFGLDASWHRFRFGVDVAQGTDETLKRAADNAQASLSQSLGSFDVGYDVFVGRFFSVYPLFGLSFGTTSLKFDPSKAPLSPSSFTKYLDQKQVSIDASSMATNWALGFMMFVPFIDPHKKHGFGTPGLTLDVRVGYLWGVSHDAWNEGRDTLPGLPTAHLQGPYARLALGFALGRESYTGR
jgi:hypothetical protein